MDPNGFPPYDSEFWDSLDIDWSQSMGQQDLILPQNYAPTTTTSYPMPTTTSSAGQYTYGPTTNTPYAYTQPPVARQRPQRRSASSASSNISSLTTYLPPSASDHRRTPSIRSRSRSHNPSPASIARKSSNTSSANEDPDPTTQSSKDDLPRCWDHGCNGRTFSCLANYKRHLRERDRPVRAVCGSCGKPFSRKSNLEMHWATGRCKGREGPGEGSSTSAMRGQGDETSEGEGTESREEDA